MDIPDKIKATLLEALEAANLYSPILEAHDVACALAWVRGEPEPAKPPDPVYELAVWQLGTTTTATHCGNCPCLSGGMASGGPRCAAFGEPPYGEYLEDDVGMEGMFSRPFRLQGCIEKEQTSK